MKIQLLDMEKQIYLSLMQPLCQIKKKLTGKRKPCNNLRLIIVEQRSENKYNYPPCWSQQKSEITLNIPLSLMIFIRMHSQESQFHNKCLICSIMSIIYVQVATFVRALGTQIQTLVHVLSERWMKTSKSYITGRRILSN